MPGPTKTSFLIRWRGFSGCCGDTGYEFATEAEAEHMADFLASCSTSLIRTYHVLKYEQWIGYEDN